ncbi:MAG: oligosaccharide flippase family protein [bacterium]
MEQTGVNASIKRKSFISAFSLFFQSGYSAILGFVANLVLTILLPPSAFGIYITVLSIIAFLNYFSDVGLAASLIQKKDMSDDDVKTTFTAQQVLIITLITLGFFATSSVKKFYNLPIEAVYLYWALLGSFFLSSLKTIPSVFLERKIQFQKIVFVQIVENSVFYISVSLLAILGFGLQSFTFSVMLRALTGVILIYSLSFWMPKIGLSLPSLKKLLSFGVPFQASSFLAIFKDELITLYLGKVVGFQALGLIGFAKKWAEAPIRIIMDNISKIIFPLIARFQDDKKLVKNLIEKILYYQTSLLAPILIGMMLIMPKLIQIIPNYNKWEPALPLFYLFAISSLLVSFSAPFMNILNALGKVKTTFLFMVFFTILIWFLTPVLISVFGLLGFPIAHLIVSTFYFLVLIKAKSLLKFDAIKPVYAFITSAVIMGGLLFVLDKLLTISTINSIILIIFLGIAIYYTLIRYLFGIKIITQLLTFYKN